MNGAAVQGVGGAPPQTTNELGKSVRSRSVVGPPDRPFADGEAPTMLEMMNYVLDPETAHPTKSIRHASLVVNLALAALILVSVVLFVVKSLPEHHDETEYSSPFYIIEATCIAIFTIEFICKVVSCPNLKRFMLDPYTMIDVVSILPFYIDLILSGAGSGDVNLIFLRVIRLMRIFKMFKLGKYSRPFRMVLLVLINSVDALFLLVFLLFMSVILFSSLMWIAEQSDSHFDNSTRHWRRADGRISPFQSIPHTFWWCMCTLTTVGYGEDGQYPVTDWGKVVAGMTIVVGLFVMAFPVILISYNYGAMVAQQEAEEDELLEIELQELESKAEAGDLNDEELERLEELQAREAEVAAGPGSCSPLGFGGAVGFGGAPKRSLMVGVGEGCPSPHSHPDDGRDYLSSSLMGSASSPLRGRRPRQSMPIQGAGTTTERTLSNPRISRLPLLGGFAAGQMQHHRNSITLQRPQVPPPGICVGVYRCATRGVKAYFNGVTGALGSFTHDPLFLLSYSGAAAARRGWVAPERAEGDKARAPSPAWSSPSWAGPRDPNNADAPREASPGLVAMFGARIGFSLVLSNRACRMEVAQMVAALMPFDALRCTADCVTHRRVAALHVTVQPTLPPGVHLLREMWQAPPEVLRLDLVADSDAVMEAFKSSMDSYTFCITARLRRLVHHSDCAMEGGQGLSRRLTRHATVHSRSRSCSLRSQDGNMSPKLLPQGGSIVSMGRNSDVQAIGARRTSQRSSVVLRRGGGGPEESEISHSPSYRSAASIADSNNSDDEGRAFDPRFRDEEVVVNIPLSSAFANEV
eukprot:TRINITY_DN1406_c0_g1_i1.p1 TRINITY_DN1406_c0_g1~~TRINITY_DN1406_c0_g1_i1.p1  ORF type:complete len:808 (+),score=220.19 TRINITY_DN1406_c0_g1_i1:211-2634(+)